MTQANVPEHYHAARGSPVMNARRKTVKKVQIELKWKWEWRWMATLLFVVPHLETPVRFSFSLALG